MRSRYAIVIVAVILVGFGLKLIFFSALTAEADVGFIKSARVDTPEMHEIAKTLPVEKFHDMTFVSSDGH